MEEVEAPCYFPPPPLATPLDRYVMCVYTFLRSPRNRLYGIREIVNIFVHTFFHSNHSFLVSCHTTTNRILNCFSKRTIPSGH